jgi:hypothetical protein
MHTDQADETYPAAKVLARMMLMVAICLGLGYWLATRGTAATSATPGLDLTDASFVEVRSGNGDVAMSGELRDRVDALGNVEKDAALMGAGFERVIGEIEIEVPRDGSRPQELEVDVISLEPHTAYEVFINDRLAARFVTDDRGSVDKEFELTR